MDPDRPGSHPDPHDALGADALPLAVLRPPWFRCHRVDRGAIYFGTTGDGRFDDPLRSYGVLYLGTDPECTFIETFGQELGPRTLKLEEFAVKTLSIVSANRPLLLVDLTGAGLAQIGADARLVAGEHRISQLWSRAFFDHPARHDPSRKAITLFERGDLELWATPLGFDVLGRVLATYRFAILP